MSNFNERWKLGITLKPKLRTYIKFKERIETEQYINFCVSRRKISLLAQFTIGVLPLAIETGRFKSIPVDERVYVLCNINVIEDEMHMLCACTLYQHIIVEINQNRLQCYGCNEWHHAKCQRIDTKSYFDLVHNGGGKYWNCYKCSLPPFSNSFMEDLMCNLPVENKSCEEYTPFSIVNFKKD